MVVRIIPKKPPSLRTKPSRLRWQREAIAGCCACCLLVYLRLFQSASRLPSFIDSTSSLSSFAFLPSSFSASSSTTTTTIPPTNEEFAWMKNLSAGIPIQDRGQVYVSYGLCCSKEAQRSTQREIRGHNHREKPYDEAMVLSASLWLMHQYQNQQQVSIVVCLAYIKGSEESESNLRKVTTWLKRLEGGFDGTSSGGGSHSRTTNRIQIWPYDVSEFSDPSFACTRAAQMGRYYVHEYIASSSNDADNTNKIIQDNDFIMTTDSDIFPVDSAALMPFLSTNFWNPEGDYHRVFIRDWGFSVHSGATIALFGIAQTAYDWKRSLALSNMPTLKDAIAAATTNTAKIYTWGFDQTLSTSALMNGELCYFPEQYKLWKLRNSKEHSSLLAVSSENSTASEHRDTYTCLKSDNLRHECLNKYNKDSGCVYSHFKPTATSTMMRDVYDQIAAAKHQSGDQPYYKTAEMLLRLEEE